MTSSRYVGLIASTNRLHTDALADANSPFQSLSSCALFANQCRTQVGKNNRPVFVLVELTISSTTSRGNFCQVTKIKSNLKLKRLSNSSSKRARNKISEAHQEMRIRQKAGTRINLKLRRIHSTPRKRWVLVLTKRRALLANKTREILTQRSRWNLKPKQRQVKLLRQQKSKVMTEMR